MLAEVQQSIPKNTTKGEHHHSDEKHLSPGARGPVDRRGRGISLRNRHDDPSDETQCQEMQEVSHGQHRVVTGGGTSESGVPLLETYREAQTRQDGMPPLPSE